MPLVKTPQGKYVILDITEFLPGRKIPESFCEEAEKNGPFFFQPSDWTLENYWGGNAVAYIIGQEKCWPMIYSIGFPTVEAALEAASRWEAEQPEREQHWRKVNSDLDTLFKG